MNHEASWADLCRIRHRRETRSRKEWIAQRERWRTVKDDIGRVEAAIKTQLETRDEAANEFHRRAQQDAIDSALIAAIHQRIQELDASVADLRDERDQHLNSLETVQRRLDLLEQAYRDCRRASRSADEIRSRLADEAWRRHESLEDDARDE